MTQDDDTLRKNTEARGSGGGWAVLFFSSIAHLFLAVLDGFFSAGSRARRPRRAEKPLDHDLDQFSGHR